MAHYGSNTLNFNWDEIKKGDFFFVFFGGRGVGGWVRRNSFFNKRSPPQQARTTFPIYIHISIIICHILKNNFQSPNGLCIPHNRWVFLSIRYITRVFLTWWGFNKCQTSFKLFNLWAICYNAVHTKDSFSMLNFWKFSHISWQIHVLILLCTYSYIQLSFTHCCTLTPCTLCTLK